MKLIPNTNLVKSILEQNDELLKRQKDLDVIHEDRTLKAKHSLDNQKSIAKQLKKIEDFTIPTHDTLTKDFITHANSIVAAVANPLPLIDAAFGKAIPIKKGDLLVFCARAKSGKTSLGTTICTSMMEAGKKVLFISNEETRFDIYGRIAGMRTGIFYNNIHNGTADALDVSILSKEIDNIKSYITVVTHEDERVGSYQGMRRVLEAAVGGDYDMVVIDYLSHVSQDILNPAAPAHEAQFKLYEFLNEFRFKIPVVAFTQIMQNAKKDDTLGAKIEGRKTLHNVATHMIEIIPNKEAGTSMLKMAGARWNDTDVWHLGFDKGRLSTITEAEYIQKDIDNTPILDDAT